MKKIVNILLMAAVIFMAAKIFPQYIQCKDNATLIMAIICMTFTGIILAIIFVVGTMIIAVVKDSLLSAWLAVTIALGLASGLIELFVATHIVNGFKINGIATYIILAIVIGVFQIGGQSEQKSK